MPTTLTLTDRLSALAREAATRAGAGSGTAERRTGPEREPVSASEYRPEPVVLTDRPDGTVVACGGIVAKAHPAPAARSGADDDLDLTVRLSAAAHPRLRGIMLPPLAPGGTPYEHLADVRPLRLDGDRPATLWPRGAPVDPDAPEAVPWEAAGVLLARLHRVPAGALAAQLPGPLPQMRGPAKAARAMERMRTALGDGTVAPALAAAAEAAEAAWATLPAWCRHEEPAAPPRDQPAARPRTQPPRQIPAQGRTRPPARDRTQPPAPGPARAGTLCHGDFHLGQLVRHPGDGGSWQLIDVDDLGLGDPAWDLARPAAWYATGLLPAAAWDRFLRSYQAGSNTTSLDPWPALDAPARALTVQTTALAVAKAHAARRPLDEAETACAQACHRIAAPRPGQPDETGLRLDAPGAER